MSGKMEGSIRAQIFRSTLKVCYQSTIGSIQALGWNHSPPSCEWLTYLSFQPQGAYPHKRDPRPYHKVYLLYILFVQAYIKCLPNSKEQIKDVKMEGMTLKLWYTLRCFGIKENKFSHIGDLSLNPKVYLNLKGS